MWALECWGHSPSNRLLWVLVHQSGTAEYTPWGARGVFCSLWVPSALAQQAPNTHRTDAGTTVAWALPLSAWLIPHSTGAPQVSHFGSPSTPSLPQALTNGTWTKFNMVVRAGFLFSPLYWRHLANRWFTPGYLGTRQLQPPHWRALSRGAF